MSKRVIKVPPVRAGRRVHLTFEVSADVGAETRRTRKAPKKRRRATTTAKKPRTTRSRREPLTPAESAQDSQAPLILEGTAAAMTAPNDKSLEPTTPESARPSAAPAPHETVAAAAEIRTEPVAPTTAVQAEPIAPVAPAQKAQRPPAPKRSTPLRSIALAATAFTVIALLAFPRHPSAPDTEESATASQPEPVAAPVEPAAHPSKAAAVAPRASTPTSKKTLAPKAETARAAKPSRPVATFAAATPVAAVPLNEDVAAKLPGSAPPPPPAVSASTGTIGVAPVTITGCLEVSVSDDEYRLTDTEGVDAPKSRSWKTGFLKRRAAPVSLIEPSDRTALRKAVGRRVAATGTLNSHDLRLTGLRVVGPCN